MLKSCVFGNHAHLEINVVIVYDLFKVNKIS